MTWLRRIVKHDMCRSVPHWRLGQKLERSCRSGLHNIMSSGVAAGART